MVFNETSETIMIVKRFMEYNIYGFYHNCAKTWGCGPTVIQYKQRKYHSIFALGAWIEERF